MMAVWERFPDCRLIVTGTTQADLAARWLAESADYRLDPRIVITGYLARETLFERYASAHALLIPLFDDVRSQARFPTKIGEYLASARPIVTTDVGEVPHLLTDCETAFICAPGDAGAYGAKVCEALADPDKASGIGEAGREVARRSFQYSLYGERLHEGFARAAALREKAPP